jgi:hypothetical protein
MRLAALEELQDWQATVEYHGSQGQQTRCLLRGRAPGWYYWFIADYQGEWPWQAAREYHPKTTARMVKLGAMRLVKGRWPDPVAAMLVGSRSKSAKSL